jgi:alkylation response protein AidB-like acyl-CoA dehydrogenase
MDFAYTESQQMLKKAARDLLARECPLTLTRSVEKGEAGHSLELWQTVARQGWLGLGLPLKHGGAGSTLLDLIILIEELGYALAPLPFVETIVSCGLPLAAYGTAAQQSHYLPGIVAGDFKMALAMTDVEGDELTARPVDGGYRLNGVKVFVRGGDVADVLLCVTRMANGKSGVFIVDPMATGVTRTVLDTIAADRQCRFTFNNLNVDQKALLGASEDGAGIVDSIRQQSAVAECARMTGMAARVLDMTVAFSRERLVFGKPIGSFQVIQHRASDMLVDVESSRFITYEAAWRLDAAMDAASEVAIAKAWVSDACQRVCADGCHLHGAVGFTEEHDVGLFLRHAKVSELAFGDARYHRDSLASIAR